jgi:hypothetical protein
VSSTGKIMAGRLTQDNLSRRDFIRVTAMGTAAAALQGRVAVSEAADASDGKAARRPNVIVLFDDQLRSAVTRS